MRIRGKLLTVFAGLVLMTGVCGALGLMFVGRIGSTFERFSEVDSPLLAESAALADNAQRLESSYLGVTNFGGPSNRAAVEASTEALARIAALADESEMRLRNLQMLAARANINMRLDEAKASLKNLARSLTTLGAGYGYLREATTKFSERQAAFNSKNRVLYDALLAVANTAEGEMNRAGEIAKVEVQTGAATVSRLGGILAQVMNEIYPVLPSARRLMRTSGQFNDAVDALLVQTDAAAVDKLEADTRKEFGAGVRVARKLGARLLESGGEQAFVPIMQGLEELETLMLGPDGLFTWRRRTVASMDFIRSGQDSLRKIEQVYSELIKDVQGAVETMHGKARQQASDEIARADSTITLFVVLAMLVALLTAIIFASRITGPLTRLTRHVVGIRETGKMAPVPADAGTRRSDEIGMLARAFNLMIAELAEARARLIAWSEAEVRTQYERLNAALSNMSQGFCMIDGEQKLVVCNTRYGEIYGLTPELMLPGTPLQEILERRIETGAAPKVRIATWSSASPWCASASRSTCRPS